MGGDTLRVSQLTAVFCLWFCAVSCETCTNTVKVNKRLRSKKTRKQILRRKLDILYCPHNCTLSYLTSLGGGERLTDTLPPAIANILMLNIVIFVRCRRPLVDLGASHLFLGYSCRQNHITLRSIFIASSSRLGDAGTVVRRFYAGNAYVIFSTLCLQPDAHWEVAAGYQDKWGVDTNNHGYIL